MLRESARVKSLAATENIVAGVTKVAEQVWRHMYWVELVLFACYLILVVTILPEVVPDRSRDGIGVDGQSEFKKMDRLEASGDKEKRGLEQRT